MQAVTIVQITPTELELLIESSLRKILATQKTALHDKLMSIDEASEFLNLSKQTIYSLCSGRQIPFCKQRKKLYFSETDLLAWIKSSNRKIKTETA